MSSNMKFTVARGRRSVSKLLQGWSQLPCCFCSIPPIPHFAGFFALHLAWDTCDSFQTLAAKAHERLAFVEHSV